MKHHAHIIAMIRQSRGNAVADLVAKLYEAAWLALDEGRQNPLRASDPTITVSGIAGKQMTATHRGGLTVKLVGPGQSAKISVYQQLVSEDSVEHLGAVGTCRSWL